MMPIFRGKGFVYIVLTAFALVVFGVTYWIISNLPTEVVTVEEAGSVEEVAGTVCNEKLLSESTTNAIPFACVFAIHEGIKADLLITENSIQVRDGDAVVFDSLDPAYAFPETLETRNSWGGDGNFVASDLVRIHDLTYDGYADLMIQSNRGASNLVFDVIAYDPALGRYANTKLLEGVFNPVFNAAERTITSSSTSGNGAGVTMVYTFSGKVYEPVQRTERTYIDDVLTEISYVRTNGEWVEVSREAFE